MAPFYDMTGDKLKALFAIQAKVSPFYAKREGKKMQLVKIEKQISLTYTHTKKKMTIGFEFP